MLNQLSDTLNKTCLLGLTYFDLKGELLKQSLLGGVVVAVDEELGITLALLGQKGSAEKRAEFIIPIDLSCWFTSPEGEFHTGHDDFKITNPDYLVTWDVHQTQTETKEGEQQWWEWVPRCVEPNVGGS